MKYNILYADPPWKNTDSSASGKRGAIYKFPQMSFGELADFGFRLRRHVCDDAWLFMWATPIVMQQAIALTSAWGFRYKTFAFVWIKKSIAGNPLLGMGSYTRANAEVVLLGVRGHVKRVSAGVCQIIEARRLAFAEKPYIVRARITDLCGDLPKLELFARTKHAGWDAHGIEIRGGVII